MGEKNAKEALGKIGEGFKDLFGIGKEKLYGTIGEIERQVDKREGFFGNLADIVDDMIDGTQKVYGETRQRLQDTFYTDGKFDAEKAKKFADGTPLAKWGKKSYHALVELAKNGKDAVVNDYRAIVPTQEEMETKYQGIGADAKGVTLLRPDLDACLEFYNMANGELSNVLKAKKLILDAIKASASTNAVELMLYFTYKNQIKLREEVNTYLTN